MTSFFCLLVLPGFFLFFTLGLSVIFFLSKRGSEHRFASGLLGSFCLIVAFLTSGIPFGQFFEIHDYEQVKKLREEEPRLQEIINEALVDDVITGYELSNIYDKKHEFKRADSRSELRNPIKKEKEIP